MTFLEVKWQPYFFIFYHCCLIQVKKIFVVGGLDKEDLWVKQKFQSINQREREPLFFGTNGVRWENCVGLMERKSIFSMKLYNGGHFQCDQLRFKNKLDLFSTRIYLSFRRLYKWLKKAYLFLYFADWFRPVQICHMRIRLRLLLPLVMNPDFPLLKTPEKGHRRNAQPLK